MKKPIGFLTSSSGCIAQVLNLERTGGHAHVPLVGGRVAGDQVCLDKCCQAICQRYAKAEGGGRVKLSAHRPDEHRAAEFDGLECVLGELPKTRGSSRRQLHPRAHGFRVEI